MVLLGVVVDDDYAATRAFSPEYDETDTILNDE